ncbi:hypothetical protein TSAR_002674 [Trichomalopsis sarcophagae]|uniref:Uncharacterized protein n=1 Tax=Trichomalopsis sarcophagae TaxID=543379 RepID=A0A232F1G8_9HYME|nr:hypothetical protein TSAR_002674 [Trichomalopsis sarcophagae]
MLYTLKRRRKLGPAKTKTLSRGLPKGLEALYTRSHVPARKPPATQPSSLAVTDRPFSLSALKVTLKICGRGSWQSRNDYKITPNRIGLKPRIALSIRVYESQMTEKRYLKLLIGKIHY